MSSVSKAALVSFYKKKKKKGNVRKFGFRERKDMFSLSALNLL